MEYIRKNTSEHFIVQIFIQKKFHLYKYVKKEKEKEKKALSAMLGVSMSLLFSQNLTGWKLLHSAMILLLLALSLGLKLVDRCSVCRLLLYLHFLPLILVHRTDLSVDLNT